MNWQIVSAQLTIAFALVVSVQPAAAQADGQADLNEMQEKAMKAAVQKVAPSVVQIETSGGTEILSAGPGGVIRRGIGPTTGLVVSADGYIISSAFNFANKPSFIIVAIPGQKERLPATIVATDQTRMLTLLKVQAKGLAVPTPSPKKDFKVGQWSVAVGRTLDPQSLDRALSVSVGIISAVNRIWGKAIQTDAKVSPVNYGGPLIDISGQVQGVLVPASPRGEGETAGVEWYDSGIGFAIPLEDINAVLPRLKKGEDLRRGLLGITLQSPDMFGAEPVIGIVSPDSAAARADIRPGDIIIEIEGKPVINQAQILHVLGSKYEGDTVSLKIRRGKEERNLPNLKLSGVLTAFSHPFLGVIPVRDDPELGEEVRYVFPKSAADVAGIKPGDRLMKIGLPGTPLQPFSGRDQLTAALNTVPAGTEIKLEVKRKDGKKTETLTVKLANRVPPIPPGNTVILSDEIPDMLPEPSSAKKALVPRKTPGPQPKPQAPAPAPKPEEKKDDKKKPETGVIHRTTPNRDHEYWVYVPENYDPNIAHSLVIWLHPANAGKKKDIEDMITFWSGDCKKSHIIMLAPKSDNDSGWVASESDFVLQLAHEIMGQYTIDRQRVVAHGMAIGGQMAFYLGFSARDLIRGVATTGAVLTNQPKDNVATQRLAFFVAAGTKDPLLKGVADSRTKLVDRKFAVAYREMPNAGAEYLDVDTHDDLIHWIDSLDRQ